MMILRFSAIVAACLTIILNASYGFNATPIFAYAVLFAVLNATLDLAKCSCLVGMSRAWHNGRRIAAVLLFLLFWPLLANSLWCGLSEIAIVRAEGKAGRDRDNAKAKRLIAEQERLTNDLRILQANPIFKDTAACALPKTKSARALCADVEATQASLKELDGKLSTTTIQDAQPQLTWLAEMTGWPLPHVQFGLALWPVFLAELVGSLGFYLTRKAPAKATQKPAGWFSRSRRWWTATKPENVSTAVLVTPNTKPATPEIAAPPETPKLSWPLLPAA
jgi:hypothetical protein